MNTNQDLHGPVLPADFVLPIQLICSSSLTFAFLITFFEVVTVFNDLFLRRRTLSFTSCANNLGTQRTLHISITPN